MSKLGDRIRKTMRVEAAPIGFRAVRPARVPSLLVVALFDDEGKGRTGPAIEKGAGAIIVRSDKPDDVKAAVEAAGEVPCGVRPQKVDADAVTALLEAGADFLVFDAETTLARALAEDKLGYVLTLRSGQDETYLRVLESLALDAVLLEDYTGPLTLQRQVELRLVAGLTRKPLMLPIKLPIESGDLECLRDAGVSLLAIDGSDDKMLDELPALLQAIEALPEPRRRRETALEVLLPRAAELAAAEEEEEEEGEEE
jgi:hypothetical protein